MKPLPGPPEDYGVLADHFPDLPKDRLPATLYRVHRVEHDAAWFSADGQGRFDPPEGELFGTCYLAADPLTALMEVVADLPALTTAALDARSVSEVTVPATTNLADLTNPTLVGTWGLDRRISIGDDYTTCQAWAQAWRLAGFTGVHYEPRHDPRGPGFVSVALFGDPGHQPAQLGVLDDTKLPDELIQEARDRFGLKVYPAQPLI